MQSLDWYAKRISAMSAGELAWRLRSLLRDFVDVPISKYKLYPKLERGRIGDSRSLKPAYRMFVAPKSGSTTFQLPESRWYDRLRDKADLVLNNQMSFMGLDEQFLGDPVNWHRDQASGREGPVRHRTFVDYRASSVFGDCKLVWEPNRHHQLVVLARAYAVSGEEKYARKAVELMLQWCSSNPFGYGMNWKSPMEVAIRNINWMATMELISRSEALDSTSYSRIVNNIYVGTWDTARRFSRGSSANNHLIGEAAGVFIAAAYFPEFPGAVKWRSESKKILEDEIRLQSSRDGCTSEHAFGYMHFVAQFWSLAMLAGDRTNDPFSDEFRTRLHNYYRFMAEVCSDAGRMPNLGDADDGYVLDLGEVPDDPRALISLGAQLFGDQDLQLTADSETAFWLTGALPETMNTRCPGTGSIAFEESGYYLLRSRTVAGEGLAVFFDCAELGFGAIAAHGHADCLSFTLTADGEEFIVDSGTYDYFSYPEWREYFRSTRAHNTVVVDGESQSLSTGPFMWGERAVATRVNWEDSDSTSVVVGEHDGYRRLREPVIHRRSLALDKAADTLVVTDILISSGRHTVRRYLHLAPECQVNELQNDKVEVSRGATTLEISAKGRSIKTVNASDRDFAGWISDGYHRKRASSVLSIEDRTSGDAVLELSIRLLK